MRILIATIAVVSVSGCVGPGSIDPTLLNRYQYSVSCNSPQPRVGVGGLGLLEPTIELGPGLDIVTSEDGVRQVRLGINDAVMLAVANNNDVRVVSFDPEIARQEMIAAAAQFDYTIFGGYTFNRQDTSAAMLQPAGRIRRHTWDAGIRQLTPIGGTWAIRGALSRIWDNRVFSGSPVSYESTLAIEVMQPLLRDAGPTFNLARLRVARINRRVSEAEFRRILEQSVTQTIFEYWTLWLAREELANEQRLLDMRRTTYDRVWQRREIDAGAAQINQALAAVRSGELDVLRRRKAVIDAQERLVSLLGDARINMLGDFEIIPISPAATAPVQVDTRDQLLAAMEHNPSLEQIRLGIQVADIFVDVARNQTLPRLDLQASAGYQGFGGTPRRAAEDVFDQLALTLAIAMEYPLGNRERLAELRRRQLERDQTIAQLQQAADQVAVNVKERIREIGLNYDEIEGQRQVVAARLAELEALEAIEEIQGRLTPEFLQLKLNTQTQVTLAQLQELTAIRNYNISMAQLAQTTGTILKQFSVDAAITPVIDQLPCPPSPTRAPLVDAPQSLGRSSMLPWEN